MDLQTVRVREYTPADQPRCLRIFDGNVPTSFLPAERPQFRDFLDALPGSYLLLENEAGDLLACGGYAVTPGTTCADFCWGMVARELQGTGLGRLLAETRLQRIREDSAITDVALNTTQHTQAFYRKLGFVVERIVADGFAPGLDRYDMRLHLGR